MRHIEHIVEPDRLLLSWQTPSERLRMIVAELVHSNDDADFVYLNNFLKKRGKKIIIVKGGHITSKLRKTADLIINAQKIKKHIVKIEKTKT